MIYEIIEVHATYEKGQLEEVAVMWQSNSQCWVRASLFTQQQFAGYGHLMPNNILSPALIQNVAAYGMTLPESKRKKYFSSQLNMWED